jgi:hypothetical protein
MIARYLEVGLSGRCVDRTADPPLEMAISTAPAQIHHNSDSQWKATYLTVALLLHVFVTTIYLRHFLLVASYGIIITKREGVGKLPYFLV